MTSTEITPGQLVRYRETKSRWYFAVVRRITGNGIELQFFDGDRATVSSEDVEGIEAFLDRRDRSFSRTRGQLSEHFYGREIQRLRPARCREHQGAAAGERAAAGIARRYGLLRSSVSRTTRWAK